MKRQLLDAKREGGFINNEDDSPPPRNYLPVLGYPRATQPRQKEESLPVPLPMFKRLRITSSVACSPHDCTSITIDKVPNITEIGEGPPSLLYSQQQQHYRFQESPQYFSDRWPEAGLPSSTRPALVAGGIHTPSPYSNINQLLGNLHRERKNRSHIYTSTACESYEGGRSAADYLDCLLCTNHNQEHSDANSTSTSSLSSCTTAQQAAAATYHHALVVEKTPRSYSTKLYTDSRLF